MTAYKSNGCTWFGCAIGLEAKWLIFPWLCGAGAAKVGVRGGQRGGDEAASTQDGSTVDLNHGAAVAWVYSGSERQVLILRGEALFTVATDPDRP